MFYIVARCRIGVKVKIYMNQNFHKTLKKFYLQGVSKKTHQVHLFKRLRDLPNSCYHLDKFVSRCHSDRHGVPMAEGEEKKAPQ